MCLCVYVCICAWVCVCMYYVWMCETESVCESVCVCFHVHVYVCVCECMYMHVCVFLSAQRSWLQILYHFPLTASTVKSLTFEGGFDFFFFEKAKSNLKLCCEYREWGFQNVGCLCCWGFKNCLDSKWKGRLKSWALFSPTGAPGCCTVAVPLTRGLGSQRPLWQEGSGRKVRPYWATAMCQALYIHYGSWLRSFLE